MAVALLGLALLGPALAGPGSVRAAAPPPPHSFTPARAPVVTIVVGPVEGMSVSYLREARVLATHLEAQGATVRRVFTPRATWKRVRAAARGANLLIYLGHGYGVPNPWRQDDPLRNNGFGLNPEGARSSFGHRYYGSFYIAKLALAPGAIVILSHVCYAAGSSQPGYRAPTLAVARTRVDNFGAPFLAAGASAVFATDRSPLPWLTALAGRNMTLRDVFFRQPAAKRKFDTMFVAQRTPWARGILAPYPRSSYYHSVIGRLDSTVKAWQSTWDGSSPSPSPSPSPSGSPSPSAVPSLTPEPSASPAADSTAQAPADSTA